ncbi:MAG: hypothetical protein OXU45_07205 [Candidatus Melainabacteria bacterium]|nr:hypothetical protein [Candidatus Melainabacteria bacterium]
MAKRQIRLSFFVPALLVTVLFSALMPFLWRWSQDIPIISLVLAETSLIFLIVLATVPKASVKEITKIGFYYLSFMLIGFTVLSFLPVDYERKFMVLIDTDMGLPSLVSVNVLALIVLNILASLAFALELSHGESHKQAHDQKYEVMNKAEESFYEMSIREFEEVKEQAVKPTKMNAIERALLEHIHPAVSCAICVDKTGASLTSTFFEWNGLPQEILINSFYEHNELAEAYGDSKLAQLLLRDGEHWYLVAKYRGNYLLLQTGDTNIKPLIDTSYRVIKTCEAGIK